MAAAAARKKPYLASECAWILYIRPLHHLRLASVDSRSHSREEASFEAVPWAIKGDANKQGATGGDLVQHRPGRVVHER